MNPNLATARARIAACLMRDAAGNLVQRYDHLNLAGLGLTSAELSEPFDPQERGLPPLSLADLPHLRYLDLTGNVLTELPECVCEMLGLEWMGLNFNRLRQLPENLGDLKSLKCLYIRGNGFMTGIPDSVGFLDQLIELDLTGCGITKLPSSMGHLKQLQHLALDDKELDTDQKAAWKGAKWENLRKHLLKLDEEALSSYRRSESYQLDLGRFSQQAKDFAQIVASASSMFEVRKSIDDPQIRKVLFPGHENDEEPFEIQRAEITTQFTGKLILVGSQEHGKTCLQRALRGQPFVQGYKSTDGMSRERLFLKHDGSRVTEAERAKNSGPQEGIIDMTLWDMGGQEHYQHTHQMFFTPAAVYLVVTLPRQGAEVQKLDEWIELVKRRTDGRGSIIVVSTWCDMHDLDQSITLDGLQAKHGEIVRHLIAVDSETGTRIAELRAQISWVVQEPRSKCKHTWLPGWTDVLSKLAATDSAFLRLPALRDLCAEHGIDEEEEQRTVIRTGHYTGALLWREDIPAGEDVVILNPDWLCRAVARLLDDQTTREESGLVDISKLERVWRGAGRDGTPGYEPDTYAALIELMEINELAYRPKMPGRKIGEGSHLLLTQMVQSKPRQDVQDEWNAISPPKPEESSRVVAFRKVGDLGYESVPDIIYLLIFRLRDFSLGRLDYNKAIHWQKGLLVRDEYGNAGKIELEDEKLHITVRYTLENGLMHSIISRIGVGDDPLWNGRGLKKVEFVPCGSACVSNKPDTGLISMEDCLKTKKAGNTSVRCEMCHDYVNISRLMQQSRTEPDEHVKLKQWLKEQFTALQSGQEETYLAVLRGNEDNRLRSAQIEQLLQMHVDRVLEAFTSEWKEGPRFFSLKPLPEAGWNPKTWVQMKFRVTVWCEACRKPVPFFGARKQDKPKEYLGSEEITLTREWVQKSRKLLSIGSWLLLAGATGGTAGIGGLASAVGGALTPQEAKDIAAELAKDQKVIKEVLSSIPDESKSLLRDDRGADDEDSADDFSLLGIKAFGKPVEDDLKLLRYLRTEYEKKDPTWGGLISTPDDKFGRIWAHPKAKEVFG
ncbi:MAG: hypothetical protein B7Z37_00425 [Verrucomicrobia bacterium 12-59-8]|nr:MAG: hypothetical protein B7Z37_00425 [Verrucomicrobia bacterium 12-59-8]